MTQPTQNRYLWEYSYLGRYQQAIGYSQSTATDLREWELNYIMDPLLLTRKGQVNASLKMQKQLKKNRIWREKSDWSLNLRDRDESVSPKASVAGYNILQDRYRAMSSTNTYLLKHPSDTYSSS